MANPINQTNTTVPIETYNLLKEIKEKQGCTFDEVLNQLCEMEFQNNYVQQIINYELYYQDEVFPFRIIFKKDSFTIEYLTNNGYVTQINKWGLDKKIVSIFFEFIKEECARCVFLNMPLGLMFQEFDVYKIQ